MMATETSTRVLVVDDEPQVVWMLQFSLEAEGCQTYSARDGMSALDEVKEHHPNVMLLDIMMPMMDGWAVLENLRQLPEDERPRVGVVSARSSLRDRAKAAELGADAFVAKPFNVDDLHRVVRIPPQVPLGPLRLGRAGRVGGSNRDLVHAGVGERARFGVRDTADM